MPRALYQAELKKGGTRKKWHFGLNTAWGDLSMGSGDQSLAMSGNGKKGRNMRSNTDLISLAPGESNGSQISGKGQVIAQDELVGQVSGSVSFQSTNWQFQPGLATVFPWLSQLAVLYMKYRVRRLRFYYKPLVSQYAALGQGGRIVLAYDYDAASTNLQTLQQAEGMSPHVDGMPYENLSLNIDVARIGMSRNAELFVRTGPNPAGTDIKTYDGGTVYFASSGLGGSGTIGELRVAYEIELKNPLLPNSIAPPINNNVWSYYGAAVPVALTTLITSIVSLDTVYINGLGITLSGGRLTMPSGIFRFDAICTFSASGYVIADRSWGFTKNAVAQSGGFQRYTNGLDQIDSTPAPSVFSCSAGDVVDLRATARFASGTVSVYAIIYISLA